MIGVTVKKGDNPNEVVLQGQATGVASGTWYPMIAVPRQCGGHLRTMALSVGDPVTGAWTVWNVRLRRGATTIWQHAFTATSTAYDTWNLEHFDVGVPVEPGDTIDFYITGTPSFSATVYCTATLLQVQDDPKSVPICGDMARGDPGLPALLIASARSAGRYWRDLRNTLLGNKP